MRFVFRNTIHPLRIAKKLQAILKDEGIRMRRTEAMEIAAVMFGYANWHELQKSAREENLPSLWDDDAGEAIGQMRQSFYVTVLVEKIDLAKASAVEIVKLIAPSARKTRPLKQEPWRALMAVKTGGRFLRSAPPPNYNEIVKWMKEIDGSHSKRSVTVSHAGDDYEALISLSGDHYTDTDGVRVRDVSCYLVRRGEVFGVLVASVVDVDESTTKHDFYTACDLVSTDEAKIAGILCDDSDFDTILADGGIVTMIFEWEVARDQIGSGLGAAFMQTVGTEVRAHLGESALVTLAVDPLQYSAVSVNKRLNMPDYVAARGHLTRHMVSTFPILAFGPETHFKPLDGQAVFTEDDEAESLYLLNAFLAKHAPEMLMPEEQGGSDFRDRLSPDLLASSQPVTETDPGQPGVIEPGEFPSGFDVQWAATALSFGPHDTLWRHMPDDLIRITVHYRQGMALHERHNRLDRLVFDFANGTTFDLARAFLLGGDLYSKYPAFVRTGSGKTLRVNPFTDRYSVSDLFGVLKINALLIFNGEFGSPLVFPQEPIVIERSAPPVKWVPQA